MLGTMEIGLIVLAVLINVALDDIGQPALGASLLARQAFGGRVPAFCDNDHLGPRQAPRFFERDFGDRPDGAVAGPPAMPKTMFPAFVKVP